MKRYNLYWIIAGLLNLATALLHLIGGQFDLVIPLLESNLPKQATTEWLGVWHIVTIILFSSSFYLLKKGFAKQTNFNLEVLRYIGILYTLFSLSFIVSSLVMQVFAPQWILLLPIGMLTLIGLKKR